MREQRAGLRQRLADQHAGHERLVGKMAAKERLVDRDVLQRHDAPAVFELQDAIDELKRKAVRQQRGDLVVAERRRSRKLMMVPGRPRPALPRRGRTDVIISPSSSEGAGCCTARMMSSVRSALLAP